MIVDDLKEPTHIDAIWLFGWTLLCRLVMYSLYLTTAVQYIWDIILNFRCNYSDDMGYVKVKIYPVTTHDSDDVILLPIKMLSNCLTTLLYFNICNVITWYYFG